MIVCVLNWISMAFSLQKFIKLLIPRFVDLEGANIDVTEEAMAARV